jgi:hypothetical protein
MAGCREAPAVLQIGMRGLVAAQKCPAHRAGRRICNERKPRSIPERSSSCRAGIPCPSHRPNSCRWRRLGIDVLRVQKVTAVFCRAYFASIARHPKIIIGRTSFSPLLLTARAPRRADNLAANHDSANHPGHLAAVDKHSKRSKVRLLCRLPKIVLQPGIVLELAPSSPWHRRSQMAASSGSGRSSQRKARPGTGARLSRAIASGRRQPSALDQQVRFGDGANYIVSILPMVMPEKGSIQTS